MPLHHKTTVAFAQMEPADRNKILVNFITDVAQKQREEGLHWTLIAPDYAFGIVSIPASFVSANDEASVPPKPRREWPWIDIIISHLPYEVSRLIPFRHSKPVFPYNHQMTHAERCVNDAETLENLVAILEKNKDAYSALKKLAGKVERKNRFFPKPRRPQIDTAARTMLTAFDKINRPS